MSTRICITIPIVCWIDPYLVYPSRQWHAQILCSFYQWTLVVFLFLRESMLRCKRTKRIFLKYKYFKRSIYVWEKANGLFKLQFNSKWITNYDNQCTTKKKSSTITIYNALNKNCRIWGSSKLLRWPENRRDLSCIKIKLIIWYSKQDIDLICK